MAKIFKPLLVTLGLACGPSGTGNPFYIPRKNQAQRRHNMRLKCSDLENHQADFLNAGMEAKNKLPEDKNLPWLV